MAQKQYSEEAVREILKRAVALEAEPSGFTRAQLVEMAEELNISPDALDQAEQAWHAEQAELAPVVSHKPAPVPEAQEAERPDQETEPPFNLPVGKIILFFILVSIFSGWGSGWFLMLLLFAGLFAFSTNKGCRGEWGRSPRRHHSEHHVRH